MFYIFTLSNLIVVESFQYNGRIYQVNHHESTGWRGSVTRHDDRPFGDWRDRVVGDSLGTGMKLPLGDRALIPIDKLLGYCLNSDHPKGKHKAKVFKSALGITAENVQLLYQLVQQAAMEGDVVQAQTTEFGQEFKLDWIVPETDGVQLRTIWLIPQGSIVPQLVSAFIK